MALVLLFLLALASPAQAASRADALEAQIRCVVCQAQSIADSPAPLAADLRREVEARVGAGDSDAEIKAALQARYGDQILLQPPVKPLTWPLWAGPGLMVLLSAWLAYGAWRKQSR